MILFATSIEWCVSWLKTLQQHGIVSRMLPSFSRDTIALKNSNDAMRRAPNYYRRFCVYREMINFISSLSAQAFVWFARGHKSRRARTWFHTMCIMGNLYSLYSGIVYTICRVPTLSVVWQQQQRPQQSLTFASYSFVTWFFINVRSKQRIRVDITRFVDRLLLFLLFPFHVWYVLMNWRECAQSVASRRRFVWN